MTVIFVISLRLSAWKNSPSTRQFFSFVIKYFIQICCEDSSEVKIEQIYQLFCIIFDVCLVCNIITEYEGKSYVKEYSIFVSDDWDKNTYINTI